MLQTTIHIQDITGEDSKNLKPIASGALYRSLLAWATKQPDAPYIVEAETGQELSYARTLAAVNKMRQMLGAGKIFGAPDMLSPQHS